MSAAWLPTMLHKIAIYPMAQPEGQDVPVVLAGQAGAAEHHKN